LPETRPVALAIKGYVPARSGLMPLNVATPLTAATVVVPLMGPPVAMVTLRLLLTGLPNAS
jgi:hypothetical protein